jgi:predicted HD superfamily hydrolase involved in NAD metabolism
MIYTNKSEEEILDWLKNNLNEERYIHSIATAKCAKELAKLYGVDEEKAYTAGLLHDAAKCFSKEKLGSIIDKYLNIDDTERENPKTLHAPVSAFVAEKEFGVEDKEILSSIRWHTIGKLDMSILEKIVFLADKIEPETREKEYINEIRKNLTSANGNQGLDKALLACYKMTIISLVDRNLKICPLTIEIYNSLQRALS